MQNSDLAEILCALTEEEQEGLQKFMDNPTKVRKDCAVLTQYILECLNRHQPELMHREIVYKAVFPQKDWIDNKLAKLMGETLAHVRRFVAEQTARNQMNGLQELYFLQVFYQERGLGDKFWSAYRQISASKSKQEWQTGQDYYSRFLSEYQVYLLQSTQNHRKDDLNLKNTIEAFDEYYLLERHWLICQMLNQNAVAPLNLTSPTAYSIDSIKNIPFFQKPLGILFTHSIDLLSGETIGSDLQKMRNYVSVLQEYELKIPTYYLNLFEHTAINYGVRQVNKGFHAFLSQVFDIQKRRVQSGRAYENNSQISATQFLSITIHALRLKEFDWAKDFIETHKKKILGVMPSQQYYEFAMANYLFHVKDYQETCRILMTSDYEDIQCKISGRILEIKALAEQFFREKADHRVGEYLEDRVEAAILFFFRLKDVEATKKKMGKRFADTMKRIIHADGKHDAERLEIILHDIPKAEFIAERQWLTKLVEDLIGKHRKG